jgi:hypothetical protein
MLASQALYYLSHASRPAASFFEIFSPMLHRRIYRKNRKKEGLNLRAENMNKAATTL